MKNEFLVNNNQRKSRWKILAQYNNQNNHIDNRNSNKIILLLVSSVFIIKTEHVCVH